MTLWQRQEFTWLQQAASPSCDLITLRTCWKIPLSVTSAILTVRSTSPGWMQTVWRKRSSSPRQVSVQTFNIKTLVVNLFTMPWSELALFWCGRALVILPMSWWNTAPYPSLIAVCSSGRSLHSEEWSSPDCAGWRSSGQPGLRSWSPQLCDEQLLHQPGVGTDWAVDQDLPVQAGGSHAAQEGENGRTRQWACLKRSRYWLHFSVCDSVGCCEQQVERGIHWNKFAFLRLDWKKKSEIELTASVLKKRSKTHKRLKRTPFNWTKSTNFSRKSFFPSCVQYKNRKANNQFT